MTVDDEEGAVTGGGVDSRVVGEFGEGQVQVPVCLAQVDVVAQDGFESADGSFGLAVGFGVASGGHAE